MYVCLQILHRACQHTNTYQWHYDTVLVCNILGYRSLVRKHLKNLFLVKNYEIQTTRLPNNSGVILRFTAAQGLSVR